MSYGAQPWLQESWDARAAGHFMAGGAGSGLVAFTALAGEPRWAYHGLGALLVCVGLFSVFLEIGRPLRAANVVRVRNVLTDRGRNAASVRSAKGRNNASRGNRASRRRSNRRRANHP